VKELPDDLQALPTDELTRQCDLRDEHLTPLFRRWPRLSRVELGTLARMYGERLRIARFLGSRRVRGG
jgi:hypothetical protein